jgi:hypothetical protein
MKSLVKKLTLAILLIGLFMGVVVPALAQESTPPISPDVQKEKERLLAEYETALEFELKYGETATNPEDGTTVLTGESAAKMDSLWRKTVRQIEDAIARPPEDRAVIENRIAAIDGIYPEYVSRAVFIYDTSIAIEKYQTEKYFYTVDIVSGRILEIMPIDSTRFRREFDDKETVYSQDALEKMALTLISTVSEDVDISSLQPVFSDKNERNYFFRWENPAGKLPNGMTSFIQVGLSAKGELLNYVNTLSTGIKQEQTFLQQIGISPRPVLASFNELYANGGGYWSWLNNGSSATTKSNAGYCYIVGWCSPKNFYWSYTDATTSPENEPYIRGMWDVNPSSQYIYLYAFIPSTNATAYSRYTASYDNGTKWDGATIDQEIYSNVWASVLGPHFNYGVVRLDNDDDIAGYKVAWDEVMLCTSDQCP